MSQLTPKANAIFGTIEAGYQTKLRQAAALARELIREGVMPRTACHQAAADFEGVTAADVRLHLGIA